MDFGLSFFGFVLYPVYLVAVALGAWIVRRVTDASESPNWSRAVWVLTAVVALFPLLEELYIASRFAHHCKDDGVWLPHVLEADGYFSTSQRGSTPVTDTRLSDEFGKAKLGKFNFREYPSDSVPGKIAHVRRREDGGYEMLLLDEPRARYEYRFEYQRGVVDYKIRMIQDAIIDRQTGKPAATDTRYLRYPAFLDALWMKFFGIRGSRCEGPVGYGALFGFAFTATRKQK